MNERNDTMDGENERDDRVACSRCDGSGLLLIGRDHDCEQHTSCPGCPACRPCRACGGEGVRESGCRSCNASGTQPEETEVNDTTESVEGEGVERFYFQSQTVFDRETGDRWTQPHASFAENLARAMNALVEQGRQQEREAGSKISGLPVNVVVSDAIEPDVAYLVNFIKDANGNLRVDAAKFENAAHTSTQNPDKDSVEGDDRVECAGRPTGTIFELDLFRERLEKYAATIRPKDEDAGEIPDDWCGWQTDDAYWAGADYSSYLRSDEIRGFAAELKTLIDNCQKQYAPTDHTTQESPQPPQPVEGERWKAAKEIGNSWSVCDTVSGERIGVEAVWPKWAAEKKANAMNAAEHEHQQALLAAERERVVERLKKIVWVAKNTAYAGNPLNLVIPPLQELIAFLAQQEGEGR